MTLFHIIITLLLIFFFKSHNTTLNYKSLCHSFTFKQIQCSYNANHCATVLMLTVSWKALCFCLNSLHCTPIHDGTHSQIFIIFHILLDPSCLYKLTLPQKQPQCHTGAHTPFEPAEWEFFTLSQMWRENISAKKPVDGYLPWPSAQISCTYLMNSGWRIIT